MSNNNQTTSLNELYRDLLIDELVKDYYLNHDSDKTTNAALKQFTKNYIHDLFEREEYQLSNNSPNTFLPPKNKMSLVLNSNLNLIKNLKIFEMVGFNCTNTSIGTLQYLDEENGNLELKDFEFKLSTRRLNADMSLPSVNDITPIDKLYKEIDPKLFSVMKNTLSEEQLTAVADQMAKQTSPAAIDPRIGNWNNNALEDWTKQFVYNLNGCVTVKESKNAIINTIDTCLLEYKNSPLTMKSQNIWIIINGSEMFETFKKSAKNAFSLSKTKDESYLSYKGQLNGTIKVYYIDDSAYDFNLYIGNKTSNVNCGLTYAINQLITLTPVVISPMTYEACVTGLCRFFTMVHPKIDLFHKSFKLV